MVARPVTSGWSLPRRMMDPLPNCFSMVATARPMAFSRLSGVGVVVLMSYSFSKMWFI